MSSNNTIRACHALTPEELDFCHRYAANLPAAPAYRRSFLDERRGVTYERAHEGEPDVKVTSKEVSRRATRLLDQPHIKAYLAELALNESDTARAVLGDQVKLGDAGVAMRATETILKQEDKLGFRDATERFWEITCEAGAEIRVPFPETCHACGAQIEAAVPASVMFGPSDAG